MCAFFFLLKVNDVNHKGETPLLLSVLPLKNNVIRPATARLLLQAGADANIASNAGDLPIHWAVMHADQELISMMLEVCHFFAFAGLRSLYLFAERS